MTRVNPVIVLVVFVLNLAVVTFPMRVHVSSAINVQAVGVKATCSNRLFVMEHVNRKDRMGLKHSGIRDGIGALVVSLVCRDAVLVSQLKEMDI